MDTTETYKPQILIGHEEPHYEIQGEPYWLIRYAGDDFSYSATPVFDAAGKPTGKQNKTGLKPHLQWILKFPNRACKGYPEDLFMIDEVWSIVSGTITRNFGGQIMETSQRWLFANKQDAFDCFPPNPALPFASPKLHLRITCMALRHIDYCFTVENGLANYRVIDYYRQIHWEEHSPLIDPAEKPHEAVNANIRYWFGAIKKVEEMFFGDFKGAGYPDLLLWECPPESFSEDVKCNSADGWEYQCNPYFNIPQHLWSRTIMPNRHGNHSGQPKAIATDWKGKYQSINPCAVYVPNEGEGDENCYSN
jgi:hypothetical protein